MFCVPANVHTRVYVNALYSLVLRGTLCVLVCTDGSDVVCLSYPKRRKSMVEGYPSLSH